MPERTLGWKLPADCRAELLKRFPPRYAQTVADHVTHGAATLAPPLPEVSRARVVGHADDDVGLEALVVELAGGTGRWDGSTYHITWSLEPGRAAKESNDVFAKQGWTPLVEAVSVALEPAEWP